MKTWNKIIHNPIVLAVSLVVLSQIAAGLFRQQTEKTGNELLAPLNIINQLQTEITCTSFTNNSRETTNLGRLNKIIIQQKEQHKLTFLELYRYHFASVSLLTIFSILTGILGFLVAQKGWKNTNPSIRTIFLTCGALTSFYGLSINVYKQDVGIRENIKSYIQYDNIQKEILNYCSTSPNRTISGDTVKFGEFHTYIVRKMIETNNIYLEFDKDAIDVKDYLNQK